MRKHGVRLAKGLPMVGLVLAVGCAGPRMIAPADVVAGSDTFEATDRSRASGLLADESFVLGPYKVSEVSRDANSTRSFTSGDVEDSKTTTRYEYNFEAQTGILQGVCASNAQRKNVDLGDGAAIDWGKMALTCECVGVENLGPATIEVRGNDNRSKGGTVRLGTEVFHVKPITEQDGVSFHGGPAGFRVDSEGGHLGAVETLYPGKVWIARGTEPERAAQLSCLFAGLMLYLPPSDRH